MIDNIYELGSLSALATVLDENPDIAVKNVNNLSNVVRVSNEKILTMIRNVMIKLRNDANKINDFEKDILKKYEYIFNPMLINLILIKNLKITASCSTPATDHFTGSGNTLAASIRLHNTKIMEIFNLDLKTFELRSRLESFSLKIESKNIENGIVKINGIFIIDENTVSDINEGPIIYTLEGIESKEPEIMYEGKKITLTVPLFMLVDKEIVKNA